MTRALTVTAQAATHVGRVRRRNEDAHVCRPNLGLYAVLDGIGGALGGAECSATAARHLAHAYALASGRQVKVDLLAAVTAAHEGVKADKRLRGTNEGGTTLAAAAFTAANRAAWVAWSGDSRVYRLRPQPGTLELLTKDHHSGVRLTRAIGEWPWEPEVRRIEVRRGDRLLLCTDGLTGELSDAEIAVLLAHGRPDAAHALVAAAVAHGGSDNVTAVVVEVS